MRQISLQNATAILLQNATEVYYKMRQVFCYKMRQFYYKLRQLLQNATFIINCNSTNNKENNSVLPNKYKRSNTNSRVKHETKKPKDNFYLNDDSDKNNFDNGGSNDNKTLDSENHIRHVNNTRNTVFLLGDSIVKN